MPKTAKLFSNGNSQAVRLPQEFRFKGDRVRIRKEGNMVILEPIISDMKEWFAEMDRFADSDAFEGDWRKQPIAPTRKVFE
jgi:antitoxin VapB